MPEVDAFRARKLANASYEADADEVHVMFANGGERFGFVLPRSIVPLVCTVMTTQADKASAERKAGEQEFQALTYEGMQLGFGPDGRPVVTFMSRDGSRLNMSATPTMAADLRNLARALDDLSAPRPAKPS